MADWYGNRHNETFIFRRVKWSTFATADEETETYTQFTGGTIDHGAYTNLRVTGSFAYVGAAPDTVDLLRVYYRFTDDAGETIDPEPLGTFLVGFDAVNNTPGNGGLIQSGTATGYSVLKVLSDRLCGLPLTIPAGTDPVQFAATLARACGLRVNAPASTSYSLANAHTFEASDTYLTVVNWCLTNCPTQYAAAWPDAMGVLQMQPYQEPTAKSPRQTFRDDERSIMLPTVSEENAWQSSANVVRLYYEDEATAMWASASNDSGSRSSLDVRGGRETTYYEQVDEVADLAALQALALSRLKDRASEIERVSLTHAYVPLTSGDAVRIEYADRVWTGTVQTMHINLAPAVQTITQLRRFASSAISATVDGAVIWSA